MYGKCVSRIKECYTKIRNANNNVDKRGLKKKNHEIWLAYGVWGMCVCASACALVWVCICECACAWARVFAYKYLDTSCTGSQMCWCVCVCVCDEILSNVVKIT